MPKFIHTADLHVGKSRTLPDYLERQATMIDQIYKVAADQGVNTVLMAGDIFESKAIRWNEQQMFIAKLFEYDAKGFRTVVCNGNHDELAAGQSHLWLPAMIAKNGGLKNTYVIDGEPQVVDLGDLVIAVIPVVHKNVSTSDLSELVKGLHARVEDFLTDRPFVVMLHATIAGCNTDSGVSLSGGPRIPSDCSFVDYFALGDIHMSQQMAEKAWYSGSPIQHDFGDKLPKGVLTVEVVQGEDPKVELVPLEGITPLVTISEVPDKWPTGCHIRYTGPTESLIDLPSNVVKMDRIVEVVEGTQPIETQFSDALTDGLLEFLVARGIPDYQQKEALEWVLEKYRK